MIEQKEVKERIEAFFRPRNKETETLTEYVKALVKTLEQKVGFSEFHSHIQLVLKTYIGKGIATKEDWALACAYITNNEGIWLTAIGEYLSPEQIEEWDDRDDNNI